MVDLSELMAIAEKAARRGLDPTPVVEVQLHDAVGMDGEDAIRAIVVIPDDRFAEVDGTHFLSALVNVRQDIRQTGEPRETFVEYATPLGLIEDVGP